MSETISHIQILDYINIILQTIATSNVKRCDLVTTTGIKISGYIVGNLLRIDINYNREGDI